MPQADPTTPHPTPTHLDLWGKADPKNAALGHAEWHPLAFHILDCAAVAERLLLDVRPGRLTAAARALGLDEATALPWMLLFVALHDLGKATPAFQHKADGHVARLTALGFDFPESNEPHGALSSVLVDGALTLLGVERSFAKLVAKTVGAHHGDFATDSVVGSVRDVKRHLGKSPRWVETRAALARDLAALVGVTAALGAPPLAPSTNAERYAFAADLAGLTTAADWVGSNAEIFRYTPPTIPVATYWEQSRELAREALSKTGFRAPPRGSGRSFQTLFGKDPWPLHALMERKLGEASPGGLWIVEAPMGEGKTEAALLVAEAMSARGAEGLFFALPTQATANQILTRVRRFLDASYEGRQGLHLVHGGAALSEEYGELRREAFRARSIDGPEGRSGEGPVADAWFTKSKRALLAPTGVGTVDQSLLGVLHSKHHFLRLHGLAGKVFVVDEVHAYDLFTSTILARLCEWLAALGATVVLLSATLATAQRERLVRAFGAEPPRDVPRYPRVTVVAPARRAEAPLATVHPFEARRPPLDVGIVWRPSAGLVDDVVAAARAGANVAWIVNTVSRAQELFLEVKQRLAVDEDGSSAVTNLLHARLPFSERLAREKKLLQLYGPPGPHTQRPQGSILVGTQVLEQSLDFDFDAMVTELAPVDLVLQRAGRLHRHDRPTRPAGFAERALWIEEPAALAEPSGPTFGNARFVYDEAVLLRSFLALRGRATVTLPGDIETLVEEVYTAPAPQGLDAVLLARLETLHAEAANEAIGDEGNARQRLLPSPSDDAPFADFTCRFDEEDPEIHEALRAITRLGEPTVTVVCVRPVPGDPSRVALATNPAITFAPDEAELPHDVAVALAKSALSLSRRNLVKALLGEHPRALERSGLLRHHRLLRLDAQGRAEIDLTPLCLHPELGLVVGPLVAKLTPVPEGASHVG